MDIKSSYSCGKTQMPGHKRPAGTQAPCAGYCGPATDFKVLGTSDTRGPGQKRPARSGHKRPVCLTSSSIPLAGPRAGSPFWITQSHSHCTFLFTSVHLLTTQLVSTLDVTGSPSDLFPVEVPGWLIDLISITCCFCLKNRQAKTCLN